MPKSTDRLYCIVAIVGLALGFPLNAAAAIIHVDFSDASGPITSTDTYNTIVPTASGANTSLEGSGEDFLDLLDTTGTATGVDLNVLVTSAGGDVRAGNPGSASNGPTSVLTTIDANALNDGFWVNNGTSNTTDFGFTLTFTDLTESFYNITLTGNASTQRDTTWSITTGTGDLSTTTISGANATSTVASWSNVAPLGNSIVISSTASATTTYRTSYVGFVSLASVTAVPEPSSFALGFIGLLSLGFIGWRRRRRRRR